MQLLYLLMHQKSSFTDLISVNQNLSGQYGFLMHIVLLNMFVTVFSLIHLVARVNVECEGKTILSDYKDQCKKTKASYRWFKSQSMSAAPAKIQSMGRLVLLKSIHQSTSVQPACPFFFPCYHCGWFYHCALSLSLWYIIVFCRQGRLTTRRIQ